MLALGAGVDALDPGGGPGGAGVEALLDPGGGPGGTMSDWAATSPCHRKTSNG